MKRLRDKPYCAPGTPGVVQRETGVPLTPLRKPKARKPCSGGEKRRDAR